MDTDRQNNYTSYLGHLSSSGTTYRKIGLAAKYVLIFLEEAEEISRRGYQRYKRAHASELSTMPGATDAILDFLSFIGVGYSRAKRKVKSLEKKEDICARNEKKVNEFIEWLDTESDASERTRETYRFAIRSFFSYADEFNQENVKRFLKTLEEQKMKPSTINNRICALVKYSKFAKKPISVKRVKTQRRLSTDNIPTEKEYQALLAYLKQKPNRDPYYWLRILATTGLRLHEFMKLSWEDVANGEVVLKGKGSKFRQVFFQKSLQQEVREYMKETGRTGHLCMGKYGPMTDKGFSERLKSWGGHLGIARSKMHAHAFRHFFAKQYLKKNKDVTQLAELLGHNSLDTTMIYLQKSHDEQKRDFNRNVTW